MKQIPLIIVTFTLLMSCAAPEKIIKETVFYPPLPQQPRLQFLTSISSEADIGKKEGAFTEFLTGEAETAKEIRRPYDIAPIKDKIYVLDRQARTLITIDLKNSTFDQVRSLSGVFSEPSGIWVSEDDLKYVTEFKKKIIEVYDQNDKYLRTYGRDILDKPLDVAVYEDKVYVCDFNLHQIVVFEKDSGEPVQRIGEIGKDEGKFHKPTHITVDIDGNLYVNDAFNFRIQKFDSFGDFVRVIGYHGDTVGGFARPKGIAVSREGHLYVADAAFENVQIFDANTGDTLLWIGGYGGEPGNMYLPSPVAIDYENLEYFKKYVDKDFKLEYLLYVGNSYGNHKINVYGFGHWIGEPLPEIVR